MWRKSLWLVVPCSGVIFWAAYTWHQTTHAGRFINFLRVHPSMPDQQAVKIMNKDLVGEIAKLAVPDEINLYLESIGFTCKSYYRPNLPKWMALQNEISAHYCVYKYGIFSRTHEWRISYSVTPKGKVQSASSNQICFICP